MRKLTLFFIISSLLLITGCNGLPNKSATPIKPSLPISEESEVLRFKTYSSTKYGFEFQYPSDWIIIQNPIKKGDPLVISKNEKYPDDNQNYIIIWPDVLTGTYMGSELKSKTESVIDGVKATKELYLWGNVAEGDIKNGYYRIYIYKNDKTIEFTIEYPSNDDNLYEKIMNSVKFIK
jgi:hypothetical protein